MQVVINNLVTIVYICNNIIIQLVRNVLMISLKFVSLFINNPCL